MKDDRFIGVFDSGIGGLTVLKELAAALPHEKFLYLGDTARVPYGSRPRSTIVEYTLEAGQFLSRLDIKALVVACNTISSVAMPELTARVDCPVIGVVRPAARAALNETVSKRIGVIGTRATISSSIYKQVISDLDPEAKVFSKACPLLVPLVEDGKIEPKMADLILRSYLSGLVAKDIDTLILGCTHYAMLMSSFRRVLGNEIGIVNGARAVAEELKNLIVERDMAGFAGPHLDFYLTAMPRSLDRLVRRMFAGGNIDAVIQTKL